MARWGEGDPRWIVEDRPDSTNVNNWHWREKSASTWSSNYFNSSLANLAFTGPNNLHGVFTQVSSLNGESTVSNRKGKLIYIYEYELELKWTVDKKFTGILTVANVAHDTEPREFVFDAKLDEEEEEANEQTKKREILAFVKKEGVHKVIEVLTAYPAALTNYAKDVILPTRESLGKPCGNNERTESLDQASDSSKNVLTPSGIVPGASITKFEKISLQEDFKCNLETLFKMFTERSMVEQWTRGNCQECQGHVNGKFVLYDGNVTGTFTKLDPKSGTIEMDWRFGSWPTGFKSIVHIAMDERDDHVVLKLRHEGIPEYFVDNTRDGWRRCYFEPIKILFGYCNPFGFC